MMHSTRPCFQRLSCHAITRGHQLIQTLGNPTPWLLWETSASRIPSFQAVLETSLSFKEDNLTRLKRKGFHVSTYREEKPQPAIPKEDKHQSPHIKENVPSSSHKEEPHKTSSRNSEALSPQAPDSTSSKKSSHWGKSSPPARQP